MRVLECPYVNLEYWITQNKTQLSPDEFEREIMKIPNYNPTIVPLESSNILGIAINNRQSKLAEHIATKWPQLWFLRDENMCAPPLKDLLYFNTEWIKEGVSTPNDLTFLDWAIRNCGIYLNAMEEEEEPTTVFASNLEGGSFDVDKGQIFEPA